MGIYKNITYTKLYVIIIIFFNNYSIIKSEMTTILLSWEYIGSQENKVKMGVFESFSIDKSSSSTILISLTL